MQSDRLHASQWLVLRIYLALAILGLLFGAYWTYLAMTRAGSQVYSYLDLLSAALEQKNAFSSFVMVGAPLICMVGAGAGLVLFALSVSRRPIAVWGTLIFAVTVIAGSFVALGEVTRSGRPGDYVNHFKLNVMPLAGISGAAAVWLIVCKFLLARQNRS